MSGEAYTPKVGDRVRGVHVFEGVVEAVMDSRYLNIRTEDGVKYLNLRVGDVTWERLPDPEPEPGTRVRARFGDVVIEGPTRRHFSGGSCIELDIELGSGCFALASADSWEIADGAP